MRRRALRAAPALLAFGLLPAGSVADGDTNELLLFQGEVRTLNIRDVQRVAVGNGAVVSTRAIEGDQLVLIGSARGETTLEVWTGPRRSTRWSVRVAPENAVRLLFDLQGFLEEIEGLTAQIIADRVVLSGVYDPEHVERMKAVTQLFPSVLNLSQQGLRRMVHMDVQILLVRESTARELGIRWTTRGIGGPAGAAGWQTGTNGARVDPATGASADSVFLGLDTIDPKYAIFGVASEISSRVNLALDSGRAYQVAAPRLSTRSGGKAEFLSGGEIPVVTTSFEGVNVEYKEFGLKLEIEPTADDAGNIRSQVDVELSARGEDVSTGDGEVPSFITRRAASEISVRDGEMMAISGLVDIRASRDRAGIWGLSQIPLLGALFRNSDLQTMRDELLILVTPKVVSVQGDPNQSQISRSEEIRGEMAEEFGESILD